MAFNNGPFGLSRSVFGTEQVFWIDFEFDPLESCDTDGRQKYGYHEKVPRMFGHHVAEPVKGFRQPFIDEFYAASHVCKMKKMKNSRHFNDRQRNKSINLTPVWGYVWHRYTEVLWRIFNIFKRTVFDIFCLTSTKKVIENSFVGNESFLVLMLLGGREESLP